MTDAAAQKRPLGVLILHGFTGSLDTVRPIAPQAEALGLPWRMPALRGHNTRYEDLVGVTWRDWVADAEAAFTDLQRECEQVIVVGLSMGGLCAIQLGLAHPEAIKGLVLIAPALRFKDPLTHLTPLLKLLFTFWDSPSSFLDKRLEAEVCTNYKKFPTAAFSQLLDLANDTERRLPQLRVPVVGLFARKDQIIHPIVPKLLADKAGSPVELVFFETSGHEMLQDNEANAVARGVGGAIGRFVPQPEEV
jgi:carboxylesterase